jgi:two-component system, LytTR family, response regulator
MIKPLRIIIVDDEQNAINVLNSLITEFYSGAEVVGTATNALQAVALVNKLQPDAILLDVNMPNGTGFDFLEAFPKRDFKLIFTTASEEYMLKAIQVKADNYLLKPIDLELLTMALDAVRQELLDEVPSPALHLIPLPIQGGYAYIKPEDVIHLSSDGNYTTVFLRENKKHLVSKHLGFFATYFSDVPFFKCHQSHIINLNEIVELQKGDGGFVVLSNGSKVPISRANKDIILDLLNR